MKKKNKRLLISIIFYFISATIFGIKFYEYPLNEDAPSYYYIFTIFFLVIAVFYFINWIRLLFKK